LLSILREVFIRVAAAAAAAAGAAAAAAFGCFIYSCTASLFEATLVSKFNFSMPFCVVCC
jgi:hypothetical protein